jgi:hypothetical protein
MPKTNKILQSLNAGELSPLMDMRIDQDKYQMGCRTMENFYPLIYGGAERRPGTYYAGTGKIPGQEHRLIDFVYSVDQAYILEFGNQYIRVFVNNGRFVGELVTGNGAWATDTTYYAGDIVDDDTDIWRCLIKHVSTSDGSDGTGGTPIGQANPTQWEDMTTPPAWADATAYSVGDTVTATEVYICVSAHTSATAGGDGTGGTPASLANPTQWRPTALVTSDSYPIYEIPTPYLTADLFQLKLEQSADVMYITHPSYEPRKLSRISGTTFRLEELRYKDGPFMDENTVRSAKMAVTSDTLTIDSTDFSDSANADGEWASFAGFSEIEGVTRDGVVLTEGTIGELGTNEWGQREASLLEFLIGGSEYILYVKEDPSNYTSYTINPVNDELERATAGQTVTLTATGQNSDGTAFEPFQTGTTAGHGPSGSRGGQFVGTSQTLKAITGALFQISHNAPSQEIDQELTAVSTAEQKAEQLLVYKGISWDFVTNGIWSGTIKLQRKIGTGAWETLHTVVSEDNANVQLDGVEESGDAQYRINMTKYTSGTASALFSIRDNVVRGIVRIKSVESSTSATAKVVKTVHSINPTHRWSEGYWSNYRGWPNAVAISSEERLTFVGSPSFPLTTWGSVSGDYTSMQIGVLDDDAIIFTLVGSGRQNEILWVVSKNALILGTYGGEHLLGASDDKEAMTPSNVRAVIQSTYGSHDIQAILVGDSVLFIQRGGRRVREMHYDFAKDTQVSDDLTVFSNHITESQIKDIAYQRTPDPMIWCTREDGQMAVMSYERAQEVYSWCRVLTSTNAISPATDPTESDIESVAVIPTSGEEDQVWISVERDIPGIAGYDADNLPRYIEYFSTRDF